MITKKVYYNLTSETDSIFTININPGKVKRISDIILKMRLKFYRKVAKYVKRYNQMLFDIFVTVNITKQFLNNFTENELYSLAQNFTNLYKFDNISSINSYKKRKHLLKIFKPYMKQALIDYLPDILKLLFVQTPLCKCKDIEVYINKEALDEIISYSGCNKLFDLFFLSDTSIDRIRQLKKAIKLLIARKSANRFLLSEESIDMNDVYSWTYSIFNESLIECIICTIYNQKCIIQPTHMYMERNNVDTFDEHQWDRKAIIRHHRNNMYMSDNQNYKQYLKEVIAFFRIINNKIPFTPFNMDEIRDDNFSRVSTEIDRLYQLINKNSNINNVNIAQIFDQYITSIVFDKMLNSKFDEVIKELPNIFQLESFELLNRQIIIEDVDMDWNIFSFDPDIEYGRMLGVPYVYISFAANILGNRRDEWYILFDINNGNVKPVRVDLIGSFVTCPDKLDSVKNYLMDKVGPYIWKKVFKAHEEEIDNFVKEEMRTVHNNIVNNNTQVFYDGDLEKFLTELKYYYGCNLISNSSIKIKV